LFGSGSGEKMDGDSRMIFMDTDSIDKILVIRAIRVKKIK
jgi:hypothetical protein